MEDSLPDGVGGVAGFGVDALIFSFHAFRIIIDGHGLQDVAGFNQAAQAVNALIEVVLDFIEITVVAVGDFRRNIAFGDPVDVFGGDVERTDDGVKRIVHAGDDFLEVSLMFAGIGAGGQLSFHGG